MACGAVVHGRCGSIQAQPGVRREVESTTGTLVARFWSLGHVQSRISDTSTSTEPASRALPPSHTLASLQSLLPRLTPFGLLARILCLQFLARSTAPASPSLPGSPRLPLTAFFLLLVTILALTAVLLLLALHALHDRCCQRQAPAVCLQARTRSNARFSHLTALDEVAAVATLTAPLAAQEERKREGCRNTDSCCSR